MSEDGPRAPRADEFQELLAQVNGVMREEVGAAPTYGQEWPRIYCRENLENIRVILVDGRIVSSAAIYPHETRFGDARLRVGGITGVATDTAYRRRGYGTRVMQACIERMAELGCQLSLLGSGVPSWYRKLGWEYAGRGAQLPVQPRQPASAAHGSRAQDAGSRRTATSRRWRASTRHGRWAVCGHPVCCARCGRQSPERRSGSRCGMEP